MISFTPMLHALYDEAEENDKPFEVIFVSSDRDAKSLQGYMEGEHGTHHTTRTVHTHNPQLQSARSCLS